MQGTIEHHKDLHRFTLTLDRGEAELTYRLQGNTIVFDHTYVPPAMQHQGLANRLAEAALAFARKQNLHADPQCRFMAVYIKRHPEHHDLLKQS